MKSLTGHLILDNGKLAGSFFHRSVVLICQHNGDGAFGLILNRASDKTVGETLAAPLSDSVKEQSLFVGGPVQPQALSFLYSDSFLPEPHVFPGLRLEHSLDALTELAESYSTTQKMKIFAGYAGWSPGQLDDELKRDSWLTHAATLEHVFCAQPERLWPSILKEKGGPWRWLADAPEDLSRN